MESKTVASRPGRARALDLLLWQPSPGAPDSCRQGGNEVEVVYRFYAGMDLHKNSITVNLTRRGALEGK